MRKHNEYLQREKTYGDLESRRLVASWTPPEYRKWPEKDFKKGTPLKVFFMNECPAHWVYNSDRIYRSFIMITANGPWKNCFTVGVNAHESQIRVKFHGKMHSQVAN